MYCCALSSSFLVTVTGSTAILLASLLTGDRTGVWKSSYYLTFSNKRYSSNSIFLRWELSSRIWLALDYFWAFLCWAKESNGLGGETSPIFPCTLSFLVALLLWRTMVAWARYNINLLLLLFDKVCDACPVTENIFLWVAGAYDGYFLETGTFGAILGDGATFLSGNVRLRSFYYFSIFI